MLTTLTLLLALPLIQDADADAEREAKPVPEPLVHVAEGNVEVDGRILEYEVSLRDYELRDEEGEVNAHMAAFAYVVRGEDPATRPVTFAFNGGPGSSSVWLHMGILGPRRVAVPSDAENAGAPPYPVVANPHTLLTHTDLVFVDPIGTGFSRAVGKGLDEDFWGVDEDVASVAAFVREWLTRNGRWGSPKYVLGESYGGIRGALLGQALKSHRTSVALNGLLFVSPAFDIQFVDGREDDLTYITSFPTYAATALYHGAVDTVDDRAAFLDGARAFASGPYLAALYAGEALGAEQRAEVVAGLARFTGLSEDYWDRANLRVNAARFRKELLRDRGLVLGRLDMRYRGSDIDAVGDQPDSDPMFSGIGSAYVAGFQTYVHGELGVDLPEREYAFSGDGVFGKWKRSANGERAFSGWLDTVPALAAAMRDNPALRVYCANGWFDVATTVAAAEYNLSRPGIDAARVSVHNYEAGHMMYVHEPSLEAMAADLRAFYANAAQ